MSDTDPTIAESRITAQGQISVPAEVRKRLGVGPGSVLEWQDDGVRIVVRRAARYTLLDAHTLLFPGGPPKPHSPADTKAAIREHLERRHARR